MITFALITFRELFETLLVLGPLYFAQRQSTPSQKKSLLLGGFFGILFVLSLFLFISIAGLNLKVTFPVKTVDLFNSLLHILNGIILVVAGIYFHRSLQKKETDISLSSPAFIVAFTTVLREGLEIVLFNSPHLLFSSFTHNLIGLLLGFALLVLVIGVFYRFSARIHERSFLKMVEIGIGVAALFSFIQGGIGILPFVS